jgi:TRAP-type C4-dicarboxylate transport system substrate-binding protein
VRKLPSTIEEYQALTDEERAEVDAYAHEAMDHFRAFANNVLHLGLEVLSQLSAWYASLPPDVKAELKRIADEANEREARSA